MRTRISHFTTKGITVNKITRPIPKVYESPINKTVVKSDITKSKRACEQHRLTVESNYASVPKKQSSEIIQEVIRREVELFKNVGRGGTTISGVCKKH